VSYLRLGLESRGTGRRQKPQSRSAVATSPQSGHSRVLRWSESRKRGVAGGSTTRAGEEFCRAPRLATAGCPATKASDPESECSRHRVPDRRAGRGGSRARDARRAATPRAARRGRGDRGFAAGSISPVSSRSLPRGARPDPLFPQAHQCASSMSSPDLRLSQCGRCHGAASTRAIALTPSALELIGLVYDSHRALRRHRYAQPDGALSRPGW
jgi:hypothetical protein